MLTEKEEIELLLLLEAEERERIKTNYLEYVKHVHEGRWIASKHLVYICNTVQDFLNNKLNKQILVVQMPPQHGKSQSITETLPSWFLGNNPHKRVIEASYGDDLAQHFGRRNKDKIVRFGKELFGIEISKNTSAATEFELSNNVGGMISKGIMSGITGKPADLIIVDDPIKNRQEADSETYRNRMWEEWLNSINTRRSATCKVILIQTRWHEDDLAGRVIKEEKDTGLVINLPCEAEENDILGREIGDALFPEIGKDKIWLQDFKKSYTSTDGRRAWDALFQGRPTAQEGNMIKRHWFRYWKPKDVDLPPIRVKHGDSYIEINAINKPDVLDRQLQSWDLSFKDNADSDPIGGQVWGNKGAAIFLLDRVNKIAGFTSTLQEIELLTQKHPDAVVKLIEDKANGPAVIDVLHYKIGGIVPIKPEGSKQARLSAVSPWIESGNVYIPHPDLYPWVNDFIDQLCKFPNALHDEDVDCCSQALYRFIYSIDESVKPKDYDEEDEDYDRKNRRRNSFYS
jgi:predicted phage terminase large subunit-like protein